MGSIPTRDSSLFFDKQHPWDLVCVTLLRLCQVSVWGELVNHKRSLTHHRSSQGWTPRCPSHLCLRVYTVQVWCTGSGFSFFPSSTTNLASMLHMYMYFHLCFPPTTDTCRALRPGNQTVADHRPRGSGHTAQEDVHGARVSPCSANS